MPFKLKFHEGEKVLCFHGPLIYEAKCLKTPVAKEKDKTLKYQIHYNGWNKSWDEWVPEGRILKYTDANLQKQKELKQQHLMKEGKGRGKRKLEVTVAKASGSVAGIKSTDADGLSRKKKGKLDATIETQEQFQCRPEVHVFIPNELKQCLVDDWDLIARQKQLVKLPSPLPVDKILKDFVEKQTNKEKEGAAKEIARGIKEYFNVLLGAQLLYKFERLQYTELRSSHEDKPMSSIYGAEHLLRLFVRLGSILAYTSVDEDDMTVLLSHVRSLLQYMQTNVDEMFKRQYEVASPDYCRKAAG
ncbi:mortality factor 4-like protein 1 [Corticium candelabrum]|uniref:mortality factor 4-like protein 1 n=1 Tax=Corticium candelabrum TaxID=121492 RepID=UPI002E2758FF|nr:mortality factor 4-like protein 1 [Corticium candelabrum]